MNKITSFRDARPASVALITPRPTESDLLLRKTISPHLHQQRSYREQYGDINCQTIIAGDRNETAKAIRLMKKSHRKLLNDEIFTTVNNDCAKYRKLRGFDKWTVSEEERTFPIAYSILFYKDIEQVETLLKAIHRPHNRTVYCLHVDAYSNQQTHNATESLAACFDNVFVVSRKETVVYAGFSRLQADLNCMKDLLSNNVEWQYFINLPSQQYPLKTNEEIVKILKIYNGASDIEGITGKRMIASRFRFEYDYIYGNNSTKPSIVKTNRRKSPPPHNITVVKGSAYGVFSRSFVEYIINDQRAKDFLNWCRSVFSPDEYYWATLHHNPHLHIPGSYSGVPDKKPWLAVFAAWAGADKCDGRFVRQVCVFGVGDLRRLVLKKELFANKFYLDFQPLALRCMEEWLFNKTQHMDSLDLQYYRDLPFIRKS
ncbi:hypothetical protein ScPMuIL_016756 [Solemya velum]